MDIFFGIVKGVYWLVIIPVALFSFFAVTRMEKQEGVARSFAGSWVVVGTSYVFGVLMFIMGIPEVIKSLGSFQGLVNIYNFITWTIGYLLYYHSYKVYDREATLAARAAFRESATSTPNAANRGFTYTETIYSDGSRSDNFLSSMLLNDAKNAATPLLARAILFFISIAYAPLMCYFNLLRFYTVVLVRHWRNKQPQNS